MNADSLSLYHFDGCPFCARVRQALARLGLSIELRDIQADAAHRRALVEATGRQMVPCLRIERGASEVEWMHESADIVRWLEEHFGG
ncbi:MAG: glutathione S-transferase N-terminal domain-containing protein [Proteobacteria bacterium]|nr:glutathione S-transferase N-terminal domain-containing protein [Pseudomonadota bacterium]